MSAGRWMLAAIVMIALTIVGFDRVAHWRAEAKKGEFTDRALSIIETFQGRRRPCQ